MELPGKQKSFSPVPFQVFIGLLIITLLLLGLWVALAPTQRRTTFAMLLTYNFEVVVNPGLEVVEVEPGSAAEKGCLQPGDKLEKVDGQPVTTSAEATDKMRHRELRDQTVTVTIRRHNQSLDLTLKSAPLQGRPGPTATPIPQNFGFF